MVFLMLLFGTTSTKITQKCVKITLLLAKRALFVKYYKGQPLTTGCWFLLDYFLQSEHWNYCPLPNYRMYFENILFWKPPRIFHFFNLPLEIPDKTKLHPWKFYTFLLDPLELPRPKTKTPGKSTLFFLVHPQKFHFIFN